jgi:hypothetical protein
MNIPSDTCTATIAEDSSFGWHEAVIAWYYGVNISVAYRTFVCSLRARPTQEGLLPRLPTRPALQLWNVAAIAIFLCLGVSAFWLVNRFGDIKSLDYFDIIILALATFRLAHLFTNDKIFDFVRVLVFNSNGRKPSTSEEGWRRLFCEVLECLWCAGIWSALITITVYQLGRGGVLTIELFAIAGAAALLSLVSKALAGQTS